MSDDLLPELFAEAVALDDAARREMLAGLHHRDAELAAALERLLAGVEGESPLDRSPWRRQLDDGDTNGLPSWIGPYRVLAELGRGGMGRVYLAEERREELQRSLAVKVLDRPAFDEDALRRFRDEVRILAALEHPGIARFIDHGRADDGTLYLALEHVEGEDVVRWAARKGLSTRQRVELFVLALEAVAHAHARGVVHRDLKPGHLLVGADGRPRLLDFGISKLVDPETQASVAVTRTDARALTPAYASPEQFRGEVVTPASDVYALGALLYELLAGSRPFVGTTGSALERAVLEIDPEAPSTAARRSRAETTRGRTNPVGVPADLDAICLKALRKPPEERYPDAAAMAADLRRWLAGDPVEARRGGRRYRVGRYLDRHRWPLAASASLLLALAALTFAIIGADGGADVVAAPMKASLMSPPPVAEIEAALAQHPGEVDLGAALVAALTNEGRGQEAELALARLKQMPGGAEHPVTSWAEAIVATSRGEAQRALAAASAGLSQAVVAGRGDLLATLRLGRSRSLSDLGRAAEAVEELERAREEATAARDDATLAVVLNDLAVELLMQGRYGKGEQILTEALGAARRSGQQGRVGLIQHNLGGLAFERGRPDLAEPAFREAIAIAEAMGARRRAANARVELARTLEDLGDAEAAESELEGALVALQVVGDGASASSARLAQIRLLLGRGLVAEAAASLDALDADVRASGNPVGLALLEEARGRVAAASGDPVQAVAHFETAARLHSDYGDAAAAFEVQALAADLELRLGRAAAAAVRLEQGLVSLDVVEEASTAAFVAEILRARIDRAEGREAEAAARFDRLEAAAAASPSQRRRRMWAEARAEFSDRASSLTPNP